MLGTVLFALGVAVGVWAILVAVMFLFQSSFIFFPSRDIMATPSEAGLRYDPIEIHTADRERLSAWYVRAPRARATVLFLHGNAGNISHRIMALQTLQRLDLDVLLFDYRGYGKSTGSPSEQGTYRDALAAWEYLTVTQGIPADRIVSFGESLGGAVATWLATRHSPAGLILESTFTSMQELAGRFYPFFPASMLLRVNYPTLERLAQVPCPVLVIHSPDDEIVPYEHGQRLFDAVIGPKQFLARPGGHNDAFAAGTEVLVGGIERFIASLVDGGPNREGQERAGARDRIGAPE